MIEVLSHACYILQVLAFLLFFRVQADMAYKISGPYRGEHDPVYPGKFSGNRFIGFVHQLMPLDL